MTVIKKLRLHGFKSFAHLTEIPFEKDFSAVIGPNGSGKSNVMDALCFVLGKSSAKSMRAEKSANLIYNGGKNKNPSRQAEVSIYFDNSKKDFPIKEKEVKVSRIVKQNGSSVYKINDKTHSRQQVVDMLSAARIDPDGHSVILQGDIIRFMEMKPEIRRELIEEIAGISVYEDKKKKAMHELEKVQEKLTEADIILTEREANLRELKKERDQAKRYNELKEKIKDNKATFLTLQIREKTTKREEIEKRLSKTNSDLKKVEEKISDVKSKINSNREEISNINHQIEEKGERDQLVLRKDISELKESNIKYKSRLDTLQNEIQKIKERSSGLKQDLDSTQNKIKSLNQEKKTKEVNLNELRKQELKLGSEIKKFKEKHGIKDIDDFTEKLNELESQIEETRHNIQTLNEEKQDILREKDKTSFQLRNIQVALGESSGNKIASELKKLRSSFKERTLELSKRLNEDSVLTTNLNKTRSQLVENNDELAKIRGRNLTIRERFSDNLALKQVLKENGVYGTVSKLGEVSTRYSLALEVAAGGRINSVVVDSDATAAKCIKMLKQKRLGVVTFLPLNKMKARKAQSTPKNDKVYGLAINLIKFKPKFRNIFDYVFGSTLVVENIETARKIGIGRIRMVTLDGDLTEISGAMIGGHRRKKGVGFSEKEVNENMSKLENEAEKLMQIIQSIESKKVLNEKQIIELKKQKSEFEGEIIKIEKSLGLENKDSLIDDKEELTSKDKELTSKLKEIEVNLKKHISNISNLTKQRNSVRETLSKTHISQGLSGFNEERQKLSKDFLTLESEIKTIDNQISMIATENEKVQKILKDQEKERIDFINEIKDLNEVIKTKDKELKEKEKLEQQFYGKFKNLALKRNKLSEEIKKKEDSIEFELERIRKIEKRQNEISIFKAQVIAHIEGLEKEFEEYKDGKVRRGASIDSLKQEIREFENMVARLGNVNLRALEVYESLEAEHKVLVEKSDKLKIEKQDVLDLMGEIEGKKADCFMKTFKELRKNFTEIFNQISIKGEASLELENKEEPLNGGVDIRVKLLGKKYMDIRSLSGGEKTLAALAFIFAIQEHDPASFYLLDEVDAALDKHNSEKLSRLFSQYSSKAQYIVISHNDAIISEANQVYGVSMQQGVSKIVSLKI